MVCQLIKIRVEKGPEFSKAMNKCKEFKFIVYTSNQLFISYITIITIILGAEVGFVFEMARNDRGSCITGLVNPEE